MQWFNRLKKIDVISIPVSDQQRAKVFYQKLGFELMVENDMGNGQTWIQLGLPGSFTSITLVTWFKKMPAGTIQGLVIRCDDLLSDIKDLEAKDLLVEGLEETPWGKFSTIKDPDGNTLSLHQRIDED